MRGWFWHFLSSAFGCVERLFSACAEWCWERRDECRIRAYRAGYEEDCPF